MKIFQKLANANIAHKIGYGYALTLSVAVIGAIVGISLGEYYQTQAQKKLILVNRKTHVIHELEYRILKMRLHPQHLIAVANNLIWVQYEKDKFQVNLDDLDDLLLHFKTIIQNNDQSVEDLANYQNLVQEYEQTVQDYSRLTKSLWLEMDNLNSDATRTKSHKELILESIQSEQAILIEIRFERLIEELIAISNLAETQSQQATTQLVQARLLKRKIIVTSMLLSIGVAIFLAQYTSKAIASPIEKVTHVAKKVTLESDFNIQAQVETEDEIGLLAEAFNQLITQVKNLLIDREAELTRQKQQGMELQKAKEAADAANLSKSRFLANMSHELRTPLNGILGYAQILGRDNTLTPQQEKGLQIINNSGNHLLTLINDILDMSKIEAGKLKLFPQEMNLTNFLEEIVSLFSFQALQKGIILRSEFSQDLPTMILADEKRLRQVLINLLGNAIKFTNQGQVTLRISVIESSQKIQSSVKVIHFEVIDTGIGIAQDKIGTIFNPFEQVTVGNEWKSGTGLGLSISRQLIEIMQGKLKVKSELNKGTTFSFKINLEVLKNVKSDKSPTSKKIIGYKGQRYKLLVVDDKPNNLAVLCSMLQPLGFEIVTAEDGSQAVDLAQKIYPDLILTDLIMPRKNGFEAAQEIRQIKYLQKIPIIAISATIFQGKEAENQISNFNAHLTKPIKEQSLLELLKKFLNLDWIYQDNQPVTVLNKSIKNNSDDLTSQELTFKVPSSEEMKILHELALIGNMKKIRQQASYLREIDHQYTAFANQLQVLATGFQEKEILSLVEKYLNGYC